jgi:hypothetical protein
MQAWIPFKKETDNNNTYGWLPNPNDFSDNVHNMYPLSPIPTQQPFFLMPFPLQPPFSHYKMLKTPACKKDMLSTLSESHSDGQGSLSSLLSLRKTCSLQRSQILSWSLSLTSSFSFQFLWDPFWAVPWAYHYRHHSVHYTHLSFYWGQQLGIHFPIKSSIKLLVLWGVVFPCLLLSMFL